MSEKAKVYFASIQQGRDSAFASMTAKFDQLLEMLDFSTIEKQDKVAIKMHLGFSDGYQTVPVFFVRRVVKAVKDAGGWPFITDNPTAVYNAVERGYTSETCGCPIIPISGVKDGYKEPVNINYRTVEDLEMAGVIRDADAIVDLAHAKGHMCAGYGGALKNLAFGCYVAQTRWQKLHGIEQSIDYWDADKCTPEHAKKLVDACLYKAISYDEEKHKLKLGAGGCYNSNCFECLKADEGVGCLKIVPEMFDSFQEIMAIATKNVLDTFDENKRFFLNFLLEITPHCDCAAIAQPSVVPDIGIMGSRDLVAIDTASLDYIEKAGIIEHLVPPYFKHFNTDSKMHPLMRLWGPMKNPYMGLEYVEKMGVGSSNYEVIEILPAEETLNMEPPKREYERQPSFY
ncbi:MAG: DUF362 domain-containing protein [Candidatus Thorarchaeota archaeon]